MLGIKAAYYYSIKLLGERQPVTKLPRPIGSYKYHWGTCRASQLANFKPLVSQLIAIDRVIMIIRPQRAPRKHRLFLYAASKLEFIEV